MLAKISFERFRGFQSFAVEFGDATYLVGPNNAGKSTILNSLRVMESHIRMAQARRPSILVPDGPDSAFVAYPSNLDEYPGIDQSARYDFGNGQALIQVDWQSSVSGMLVWPEIDVPDQLPRPYFYLKYENGGQPRSITDVRTYYSPVGMVPTLGTLDDQEALLQSEKYIRSNVAGKLSSRHFRNQLWLLQKAGELEAYFDYANAWTDEIQLSELVPRDEEKGRYLDLFYREGPRRHEREIAWAGDGLQIWFQILYHVYRTRNQPTLVLDEPEVFLHPDLQRRLVRLLNSTGRQIIVATHSSELLNEVESESVVLVDRSLRKGRRMRDDLALATLGERLGSTFNLRLAKALKSKVAVFVEGKDRHLLIRTASSLGLTRLATETGATFVPTDGFDGHQHLDAFSFLCKEYLKDSVTPVVILDRDYKADKQIRAVEDRLAHLGMIGHVWTKKELESYYLDPVTIGRLRDLDPSTVLQLLAECADDFFHYISVQTGMEKADAEAGPKADRKAILLEWQTEFSQRWANLDYRISRAPAKDVLASLNRKLQGEMKKKAVSFPLIASSQTVDAVDPELSSLLTQIERLITD